MPDKRKNNLVRREKVCASEERMEYCFINAKYDYINDVVDSQHHLHVGYRTKFIRIVFPNKMSHYHTKGSDQRALSR